MRTGELILQMAIEWLWCCLCSTCKEEYTSLSLLGIYCGKAHGNPFPLCFLSISHMLQALLAFTKLSMLIGIFSFTFLVMDKTEIIQAENPVDETMFFLKFILEVKPAFHLSFYQSSKCDH